MFRFVLLQVKLPTSPVPVSVISLVPITIPVTCHASYKETLITRREGKLS